MACYNNNDDFLVWRSLPRNSLGRLVAFLASLVGMFIISALVVTLSNVVKFTLEEKMAHNLILKSFAHESMEKISYDLVKAFMRLYLIKHSLSYLWKVAKKKNLDMISLKTFVKHVLHVREIALNFNTNFEKYKIKIF